MILTDELKEKTLKELEHYGFSLLKNVIPADQCARLVQSLDEIEAERRKGRDIFIDAQRVILWNIHQSHPETFLNMINLPEVMSVINAVLKEQVILTSFGGFRNSSDDTKYNVHIDSRVPQRDFNHTFQALAMICITDFTVKNGATCFWPLSHRSGLNPKDVAPAGTPMPGKVQPEAKAGDVLFFLGQTWHDVAPNLSHEKRWGLLAYYSRWWVKPTFDYTKCGAEIFKKLSQEQKVLFGFASRPPAHYLPRGNTVTKIEDLPEDYEAALKS